MPRYAILRQAHTSPGLFDPVRQQLRDRNRWDEAGDGAIEQWLCQAHGSRAGEQFDRAAAFILKALDGGRILTVLVDELNPLLMNPLRANGWPSLVAMLVLAFPEVRWHVLVLTGRPNEEPNGQPSRKLQRWKAFQALHGIGAVFAPRGTPLFDGYGLRQHVLDCIFDQEEQDSSYNPRSFRITGSVPARPALATVLDEEEGYRWLLAYMAYRHGFRVCAIAFWQEAIALLGPEGHLARPTREQEPSQSQANCFLLSLEDWFLSYPDQNVPAMSDLRRRSQVLPALRLHAPPLRRFLTVGHQLQSGVRVDYRESLLAEVRRREFAASGHLLDRAQQISFKPASGLYTLWKELGLERDWNTTGPPAWNEPMRKKHHGLAPGYFWPPETRDGDQERQADEGHSSPGRLLHIAEHLLDRANAAIKDVNTVTEALRGAVLATQALELLGGKTPTVSVEALLLKHAFEVIAECQFPGVEYHLNLKERLADIRATLTALSAWLHTKRRQDFLLNAEALILTKLAVILEEYGEYEEAEMCQRQLRLLHRNISHQYDLRARPYFAYLKLPFRMYIEFVLRSSLHFTGVIILLVFIFWGAHSIANQSVKPKADECKISSAAPTDARASRSTLNLRPPNCPTHPANHLTSDGADSAQPDQTFYDAFKAIISGEPIDKGERSLLPRLVSYVAAVLGVLNLGILVSVLHSRMNRR